MAEARYRYDREYEEHTTGSKRLHEQAAEIFPAGVSHNVRHVDPYPVCIARAHGPYLEDVDGNTYVDFWNNHGAGILGHAHPRVVEAVTQQVPDGIHYGAMNEPTIRLGRRITEWIPSAERVRFCCSGTEATMYAVRLARAATNRDVILKVENGWHGGNTDLAHGVRAPYDQPTTTGIPERMAETVESFPLNDQDALADLLAAHTGEVAGIIIDPRRGGLPPEDAFLDFLIDARDDHGFLLILDEVVTGFRVAPGSYQVRADITPDITTLGKILGGGFPVGAICSRADLFEAARPDRDVPPNERVLAGGGTFTAHPTMAQAGLATLDVLDDEPVLEQTESRADDLRTGLQDVIDDAGIDGHVLGLSSVFQVAFEPDGPLRAPGDLARANRQATVRFHQGLYEQGYFFSPGAMGNVSAALTSEHVEGFLDAAATVLADLQDRGVLA